MKTLLLSIKDVEEALSLKEVIAAVEEGYIAYNAGQVQQPEIVSIEIPENNGETDIKSCYNKLNESNTTKLFYLHRVQRNLFFSILYLLLMAILIYFNDYIHVNELKCPCLRYIEFGIGIISLLFSIFLNNIFEKYSFWNKI